MVKRVANEVTPYKEGEFKFYINLCLENQYINDIDIYHYIDNGCFCKYCSNKRKEIYFRAKAGEKKFDKIIHTEVINEVTNEKIKEINNKIKSTINQRTTRQKFKPNQFAINISYK